MEFLIEETCDVGVETELVNKSGIERYNKQVILIGESLSEGNYKANVCDFKISGLKTVLNGGNPCLH